MPIMAPVEVQVVDECLMYVHYHAQSATCDAIAKVLTTFFTQDSLSKSMGKIFESFPPDVLNPDVKQSRRDTNARKAIDAVAADICKQITCIQDHPDKVTAIFLAQHW